MKLTLFLFVFSLCSSVAHATDWVRLSQENLTKLLELQKRPLSSVDLRAYSTERQTLLTTGVPKTARSMNADGQVFRHYVGSGMDKILACNCLKAGFTPYIIMNPGLGRNIFDDLYGIFLTTTSARPEEVGLSANANYDYIDFELHPDTGVLWIESKIFLVPGRGDVAEWLKPKYLEYKKTGLCEATLCGTLKQIDKRGGLDPMFIPVDIKCVKRSGHLQCR